MYLTIICRPLIGSFVSGCMGRVVGPQGSSIINCLCIITSATISIVSFFEVAIRGSPVTLTIRPWFLNCNWGIYIDALSSSRLMVVFVVSFVVHLFTSYYRGSDPHLQRFYSYLSLFTGSRGVLVAADNFLRLFLGWEWIGISSFLLICFWFTRVDAVQSALQALLYNRAGDWRFSMGLFFIIWTTSTVDFGTLFGTANQNTWNLICVLFLFGARAKSAQVPRHTWLPNSMEGPTPVSSLLHAATLVTAGVYLLIRSAPLLVNAGDAQIVVACIGARTAFFAASTGLVQNDIKRIIAFSTCSQIGYMIAAVGIGRYDLALFHLVNHGFFKALLFLGAGGVLHSLTNNQDIRYQGGGLAMRPITYISRTIGSLALMAFPFMSGRYSKELIINSSLFTNNILYLSLRISAAFTAYYSTRLLYITFFAAPRFVHPPEGKVSEVPYTVVFCYGVLALASLFFGYLMQDAFVGAGSDMLSLTTWNTNGHLESEFNYPLIPTLLTGMGLLAYLCNICFSYNSTLYTFLISRWNFDEAFSSAPNYGIAFSGFLRKNLDRGILELVGPRGLSEAIHNISFNASNRDRRRVTHMAIIIILIAAGLTSYFT